MLVFVKSNQRQDIKSYKINLSKLFTHHLFVTPIAEFMEQFERDF